ncbi:unnamed protein product [Menidia menidia]|uniref:(Atlantic silverside) hypothetical protein n=1 Tax=Menidia menidia TaxID=238744 RepID=A0A8S4BYY2_9TELE|nr:unnamed protein product [Menidia menidia]
MINQCSSVLLIGPRFCEFKRVGAQRSIRPAEKEELLHKKGHGLQDCEFMNPNNFPSSQTQGWNNKSFSGEPSAPPPYFGQSQPNQGYTTQPQGFTFSTNIPRAGINQQPHTTDRQQFGQPSPYAPQPSPYAPQPSPYTAQPASYIVQTTQVSHVPQTHVNDYLAYSIFTMLCCCLPLGIGALISSISVREANERGDQQAAAQKSRTALILNNVALGIGRVVFVSVIIFVIVINVNV